MITSGVIVSLFSLVGKKRMDEISHNDGNCPVNER